MPQVSNKSYQSYVIEIPRNLKTNGGNRHASRSVSWWRNIHVWNEMLERLSIELWSVTAERRWHDVNWSERFIFFGRLGTKVNEPSSLNSHEGFQKYKKCTVKGKLSSVRKKMSEEISLSYLRLKRSGYFKFTCVERRAWKSNQVGSKIPRFDSVVRSLQGVHDSCMHIRDSYYNHVEIAGARVGKEVGDGGTKERIESKTGEDEVFRWNQSREWNLKIQLEEYPHKIVWGR